MVTYFDLSQYDDPMEAVFEGEDFLQVTDSKIEDQDRWHTYYSQILQHKETGEFWYAFWGCGSTEYQEVEPELTLTLVRPVEVVRTEYTFV